MRNRPEIEENQNKGHDIQENESWKSRLQLEVLLDIRDLLSKETKE